MNKDKKEELIVYGGVFISGALAFFVHPILSIPAGLLSLFVITLYLGWDGDVTPNSYPKENLKTKKKSKNDQAYEDYKMFKRFNK